MPEIKPAVPFAVLLTAAGLTFFITREQDTPGAHPARRPAISPAATPAPATDAAPSGAAKSRRPVSPAEFDRLVEDWRPHTTGPGARYVYTREEHALAERCVERFGCGEELIRLMMAIALQDDGTGMVFDSEVKKFLAEKAGPPDRAMVAAITSDSKLREQWCYYAGAGCTPEEAEAFAKLLTEEKDQGAVLIGSALQIAKTDPVAAMKFAVEQDDDGKWGPVRGEVFKDIVATVKDPALFPALEPEANLGSTASWKLLVERWAMEDGPGLIRHMNAHPDNFAPEDAGYAVVRMTRREGGVERAFATAQDLKDPACFEGAVLALIPYVTGKYEKEMKALAEQIQSPEGRAKAMREIKNYPEMIKELP